MAVDWLMMHSIAVVVFAPSLKTNICMVSFYPVRGSVLCACILWLLNGRNYCGFMRTNGKGAATWRQSVVYRVVLIGITQPMER